MDRYQFKDIQNVFVVGDISGDLKLFFSNLKQYIGVKSEDADTPHPMELERRARKKAREEATMRQAMRGMRMPRGFGDGMAFTLDAGPTITASVSSRFDDAYKKLKSQFSKPTFKGQFSNSVVIVTGNSGFGIHSEKHYLDFLEKQNNILKYNNTILLFVRGNNDDPSFFNEKKINLSNIKTLPDYSIVETKDKVILCIGGAISVDRTWKIDQEKRINAFAETTKKRLYWDDEAPIFDVEKLKDIVSNTERIDFVVSYTAPSFATPSNQPISGDWVKKDSQLLKDIESERLTMDKIFEFLRDNNRRPTYWAYGRFECDNFEKRSNVLFRSLMRGFHFSSATDDAFNNEMVGKMKGKKTISKMSSKKQAADTFAINPHPVFERWHNDEMMVGELPQGEEVGEDIDEEAPEAENEIAEEMFPADPDAGMAVAEAPINEAQNVMPQAAPDVATARITIENDAANGVYFADYIPNYEPTFRALHNNEAIINTLRGNG